MLPNNNNRTEITEENVSEILVRILDEIDGENKKNKNLEIRFRGKDTGTSVPVSDDFAEDGKKLLQFMALASEEIGLIVSVGASEIFVGSCIG